MARWTVTRDEVAHLARMNGSFPLFGIVSMRLRDGRIVEGFVRGLNIGNNAGEGGLWSYYGEYKLQDIEGLNFTVDVLDVLDVESVWEQRSAAYEVAGIVKIVR